MNPKREHEDKHRRMPFIWQPLETERLKPKNHQFQQDLRIVNVVNITPAPAHDVT